MSIWLKGAASTVAEALAALQRELGEEATVWDQAVNYPANPNLPEGDPIVLMGEYDGEVVINVTGADDFAAASALVGSAL